MVFTPETEPCCLNVWLRLSDFLFRLVSNLGKGYLHVTQISIREENHGTNPEWRDSPWMSDEESLNRIS